MKKLFIIGAVTAILAVAAYVFLFIGPGKERLTEDKNKVTAENVKEFNSRIHDPVLMLDKLKNGSVIMEGSEKLIFVDGEATTGKKSAEAGMTERSSFTLGKILGIQSMGASYDIIVEMFADFGGSGTFNSVAVFNTSINDEYKNGIPPTCISYKVIGDRIIIDSVVTENMSGRDYDLTVRYYERKAGTPMSSAPTEKKTKAFRVSRSVLSEK